LSSNAATMVFDIVKEAIGNSLKYAEARNVNITLRAINNWLAASISDDGKGFDLAAVQANYNTRGSLGMINIQERAALAQGDAAIESAPGRGTTVTVRVPLAEKKI
ncbi:MAG: histidine kinase, partial [Chloroflexi bacterium]|nr:histidine kinase [Chloroflexota bacterium]